VPELRFRAQAKGFSSGSGGLTYEFGFEDEDGTRTVRLLLLPVILKHTVYVVLGVQVLQASMAPERCITLACHIGAVGSVLERQEECGRYVAVVATSCKSTCTPVYQTGSMKVAGQWRS